MKMKRILAVLVPVFLCFGMSAQELVIVHLNDTHSHLEPERGGASKGCGGVVERAAFIDSLRRADGRRNVLLLHAGDFNQGTSYYTRFGGELELQLVNALRYDAVTLGNHEFDNGVDDLARRVEKIKCPVLCANYDFSGTALEGKVRPYAIFRRAGLRIGVFGLTVDVSSVVNASSVAGMKFLDCSVTANRWARFLKEEKRCDFVIALTHIGYDEDEMNDRVLAATTRNIDLIVGGHSHTFLESLPTVANLDGKEIPIVQDGCWGLNVGVLKVTGLKK